MINYCFINKVQATLIRESLSFQSCEPNFYGFYNDLLDKLRELESLSSLILEFLLDKAS